jgi:endoglucanase
MTACVWDNGSNSPSKTESERYGYYNRTKQEWYFPLLMDIALKASGSQIENAEADSYIDSSFVVDFEPQNRAQEIVYDMGFVWNLGNTLDATHWNELQNAGLETETGWGQPKTTQEMIQGLKALGVKTIRIPISWHNHIEN